jgi:hypothetical protein
MHRSRCCGTSSQGLTDNGGLVGAAVSFLAPLPIMRLRRGPTAHHSPVNSPALPSQSVGHSQLRIKSGERGLRDWGGDVVDLDDSHAARGGGGAHSSFGSEEGSGRGPARRMEVVLHMSGESSGSDVTPPPTRVRARGGGAAAQLPWPQAAFAGVVIDLLEDDEEEEAWGNKGRSEAPRAAEPPHAARAPPPPLPPPQAAPPPPRARPPLPPLSGTSAAASAVLDAAASAAHDGAALGVPALTLTREELVGSGHVCLEARAQLTMHGSLKRQPRAGSGSVRKLFTSVSARYSTSGGDGASPPWRTSYNGQLGVFGTATAQRSLLTEDDRASHASELSGTDGQLVSAPGSGAGPPQPSFGRAEAEALATRMAAPPRGYAAFLPPPRYGAPTLDLRASAGLGSEQGSLAPPTRSVSPRAGAASAAGATSARTRLGRARSPPRGASPRAATVGGKPPLPPPPPPAAASAEPAPSPFANVAVAVLVTSSSWKLPGTPQPERPSRFRRLLRSVRSATLAPDAGLPSTASLALSSPKHTSADGRATATAAAGSKAAARRTVPATRRSNPTALPASPSRSMSASRFESATSLSQRSKPSRNATRGSLGSVALLLKPLDSHVSSNLGGRSLGVRRSVTSLPVQGSAGSVRITSTMARLRSMAAAVVQPALQNSRVSLNAVSGCDVWRGAAQAGSARDPAASGRPCQSAC